MKNLFAKRILGLVFAAGILSGHSSEAAKFANQFVEFELPPQWQCNLEGAEWVCQNPQEEKMREAIIVLAAKLKGPQDSLDQYLGHLKANKSFTTFENKPIKSQSKYAKTVKINDHAWVDSLHLEGELPHFYTRYLATIKEDIGVLVTYSIHEDKYQSYLDEFETLVKTLKVYRNPGGINSAADKDLFASIPAQINRNSVFPDQAPPVDLGMEDENTGRPPASQGGEDMFFVYLGLGLAAVGYILWRKKQSQG